MLGLQMICDMMLHPESFAAYGAGKLFRIWARKNYVVVEIYRLPWNKKKVKIRISSLFQDQQNKQQVFKYSFVQEKKHTVLWRLKSMKLEFVFVQLISRVKNRCTAATAVLCTVWEVYRLQVVDNMVLEPEWLAAKGAHEALRRVV